MSEGKEHTGVKLDTLLMRIIRLKNKVIELLKRILALRGKITDIKFFELMERLGSINNYCDSEEILADNERIINELEKDVKKLEESNKKRIQNAENSNTQDKSRGGRK